MLTWKGASQLRAAFHAISKYGKQGERKRARREERNEKKSQLTLASYMFLVYSRSRTDRVTMIPITEDTPPDMLAGAMDLTVHLPNGKSVKMSVERR